MNDLTLPPSPNWYLNNICACSKDGTIAWGASNFIVITRRQQNNKILNYSIIKDAHKERVNALSFSPNYGDNNKNLLVSCGDEHTVKIWNLDNNSAILAYSYPYKKQTVIGVDWCIKDPNIIYCISNDGLLISWNVPSNACRPIPLGKMTATCLSACPHDCNLVAVGSKAGLVYIVDTQGTGSIRYKLRGHDAEICSLSWCPVENNILSNEENKDCLLASGGKDKSVFLWRAGGDGRYQLEIILPNSSLESRHSRNKFNKYSVNNWTSVCWAVSTLLLTSSFWGELLAWNLKSLRKNKPKLVHSRHNRSVFFICKEPNVNKTNNDSLEINNTITVWTSSLDRKIVCCNIKENCNEIEYDITSQGGYVYCLTSCPLETSLIAFGVGDAMLRIWNLSEQHKTSLDITTLWQKIKGSIRSIAWHPTKENLIAFGTSEGRIGVFDTNGNKPPILYRQYYTTVVYTLQWGPYLGKENNYTLYCCGESDLIYYTPDNPSRDPTILIKKKCTEFSWNPDFSCLAVGFQNGTIQFYNRNFEECGHSISAVNELVYGLKWHPDSTTTDLTFSPFRNYMAVTHDDSIITILDLSDLFEKIDGINLLTKSINKVNDNKMSSKNIGKVYAILNGHSKKITNCAWNPHLSGYLVSCSFDCRAQVWNVEKQEVIATFVDHHGCIYSCMWSPIDPDVILTGSADLTLRLWRISSQSAIMPERKSILKKNTSVKSKQKLNEDSNTGSNNPRVENINTSEITTEKKPLELLKIKTEVSTAITKEVQKKMKEKKTYFPIHSKIMNNKLAILKSIKSLIKDEDNFFSSEYQLKEETTVPSLFSEDADLSEIFNIEESRLTNQGNHIEVTEMNMWHNNLKENLEIAVKEKRLNDTLVSLSPSLSTMTWREMCEAYANQLILESNPTKAVSFLLCIHKIYEAIDVFQNAQMYKEAYCLAKFQLYPNDEIITKILKNWAKFEYGKGHFEGAAHCYVKLGAYSEAASLLARRKDVDCLIIASKLALLSDECVLSKSLVEQALMEALKNSDIYIAENIIQSFPKIKYLEVLVKVFVELQKIINKDIKESTIYAWIKGELEDGVLQICKDYYEEYKDYYNDLCQYNFNQVMDNQATLWINASGQLAMAIICDSMEKRLTHLINVYSIISKFEILHRNHGSPFIKVLVYLDSTSPVEDNSIYERKCSLSKSLRAYLCVGLLNWIVDEDSNVSINDQSMKIIQLIEDVLEDIIEKQTVRYWSVTNEISKLETQILSTLGKTQKFDESSVIEDETVLVKKLDSIKNEKKQFINERINSPSPILAFNKANDLIDKFFTETFISTFSTKLEKIWTNAMS
ncbi:gem-associated protein 5 [Polistes fuscatus]|uniref:gem-associated protein 5 n=1 Tax=Polistes fuscatus TaxID=30207 RepID=UPI001CA8CD5E|nr:gem-associated protein 5 [Polistes fuscatus]